MKPRLSKRLPADHDEDQGKDVTALDCVPRAGLWGQPAWGCSGALGRLQQEGDGGNFVPCGSAVMFWGAQLGSGRAVGRAGGGARLGVGTAGSTSGGRKGQGRAAAP